MKRFSEQFNKQASSIRLSAAEKRDLEERLTAYMEYHPLPKDMAAPPVASLVDQEAARVAWFGWSKVLGVVAPLAVVLLVAVPVVAERAVPGDILYPVKVQFNEEVRGSLTFSPYEKVEWETTRLERRISEARLLASEGKLTNEMQNDVAEAVKHHSTAAQEEINSLAESDRDEAAIAEITFSAALEVQSEVLENDQEQGRGGDSIANAVSEARSEAKRDEQNRPSYEKLLARIELETTIATEYFASVSEHANEAEEADIKRRLKDIQTKVTDALALHTKDEADETAVSLLTEALTNTRKLISFMTDIDVKENVTIEELLPITLTDAERAARIELLLTDAIKTQAAADEVLADVTNESLRASAEADIALSIERREEARRALAAEEFATAEEAAKEALVLVKELLTTLNEATTSDKSSETDSAATTTDTTSATSSVVGSPDTSSSSSVQESASELLR